MTEMVSVIKFCGEKFLSQKFNLNRINDKASNVQYNITIQLSTIDNIFYDSTFALVYARTIRPEPGPFIHAILSHDL